MLRSVEAQIYLVVHCHSLKFSNSRWGVRLIADTSEGEWLSPLHRETCRPRQR